MTFDAFLETAWNDHAERPAEVAERLAQSAATPVTADQISAYARLVTHLYGEHLQRFDDGIALLHTLEQRTRSDENANAAPMVARSIAVLRYASGEMAALDGLNDGDRIVVLATAASALLGANQLARGRDALRTAMALEGDTLPSDSPAIRALAANSNNMAAALEEKSQRSAEETGFMVEAAAAALRYWQRGGTWFETQRAEFRLASSHFHAGNSGAAVSSAMRCIELCRQHDAPPFEQFFGYAMLGLAQRAAGDQAAFASSREAARVAYASVEDGEQHWCGALLAQLDAPLPADEPSR